MVLATAALLLAGYTLGPEVLVSDQSDGGDLRCEPSAAVSGNNVVVAWNDSYGGAHGSPVGTALGWALSTDRAKSFRFGGYLGRAKSDPTLCGADSRVVATADGSFLLLNLRWAAGSNELQIYRLDPRSDRTFKLLSVADSTNGDPDIDKPAMAIDGKSVRIAYTRGNSIALVTSLDEGRTWSPPTILSNSAKTVRTSSGIGVADGKTFVSWMEGAMTGTDEVWLSRADGSNPLRILKLSDPAPTPRGFRIGPGDFTLTSCDVSILPGWTLVVTDGSHVSATSSKNGAEWGRPRPIDGALEESWFPSAAIAGSSVGVEFYGREDSATGLTDTYFCILDGSSPVKISTATTDWLKTPADMKNAMIQRNFGDYISLAGDAKGWIAVWTDGRTGHPRIFSRRIDLTK